MGLSLNVTNITSKFFAKNIIILLAYFFRLTLADFLKGLIVFAAYPDVQVRQLNDDWEFIVIACDGIWEVLSNEVSLNYSNMNTNSCFDFLNSA